MDKDTRERFDRTVSHTRIVEAAAWAAERLAVTGVARVRLSPGDMTEYRLLIAAPGVEFGYRHTDSSFGQTLGGHYWVALCADFGRGYEWSGQAVTGDYATQKWTGGDSISGGWTGEVVARFLTALSAALDDEHEAAG